MLYSFLILKPKLQAAWAVGGWFAGAALLPLPFDLNFQNKVSFYMCRVCGVTLAQLACLFRKKEAKCTLKIFS